MRILTSLLMICFAIQLFSQTTTLEGYIYENGNRGFISGVSVTAENMDTEEIVDKAKSDENGFFRVSVPENSKIRIYAAKEMFDIKRVETEVGTGKAFLKLEMGRAPGYTFEVTLAEKQSSPDDIVDAITGTRIEVFNNTTRQSVMDLKDHENPEFQLNLQKGNHYTILIRKNGFLSKRMEAKVDVEGCILCFEGVGEVGPGVSDNLTEDNAFGVLLANVELERIFEGKKMEVQNLYYDLNKWSLTGTATEELNKVITLMKDNPRLTLELGAHTDSRGSAESNLILSNKRAKSAVNYLIKKGNIAKSRIVSKGYGENDLLNKCSDDVPCAEEEHAINRRTELKIIGITDIKAVKSLAQMKKEEFLEKEILGQMDQNLIQAKDEEELQRIIEADKKVGAEIQRLIDSENKMDTVETAQEVMESEEVNAPKEALLDTIDSIESWEYVKTIEKNNQTNKDLEMANEIVGRTNQSEETDEINESEEEFKENEVTDQKEKVEQIAQKEIRDTVAVPASQMNQKVTDGVKVVLFQSDSLLTQDHFIFLRHDNVEIMDGGHGKIFYMIGGFENEPAAFRFRRAYILPDRKYKGNFVASVKNGVMAVVNQ